MSREDKIALNLLREKIDSLTVGFRQLSEKNEQLSATVAKLKERVDDLENDFETIFLT